MRVKSGYSAGKKANIVGRSANSQATWGNNVAKWESTSVTWAKPGLARLGNNEERLGYISDWLASR